MSDEKTTQENMDLGTTTGGVDSVEKYQFAPIKGYPMLNWRGKRPFTSTQYYPAQLKEVHGEEVDGWRNKIFWGDNLQVMSHLLKEFRGKIDLIYIDPPFDSNPERTLFWDLLREQRVKKIYFTGMLTHGQSDFFIQYIDPDSRTVRSYYPDFVFVREEPDGSEKYVIVEVKGDHQIDNAVVQAKKDFAQQIAVASGMEYRIIKSSDADERRYRMLM